MMSSEDLDRNVDPTETAGVNEEPRAICVDETLDGDLELLEILDKYLVDLKAGRAPSRDEMIARHPRLADQLHACLAGLEFIYRAESSEVSLCKQLGDFRLLREVGRGGMGVVFEAEQVSLHRRVAVKVLRFGSVSDPEAIDRFRREAETVAHLHHTNIVPIFYVGSENSVNYYAMEFIQGRSLADVLAQRGEPIEPITAIEWGYQAAEALSHAHQRGVIHRDIKPSNLLLDDEGRIWLTDFGLAKRLDDVTLSMTGALLGTPRYMSPEQASAARHRLDHRTDIYSLGATLYELMTGRPVFMADTAHQIIDQILNQDPIPPRQLSPALSRDMETILLKCLGKEPDQRYASARDLADDFRALLDGRPIKARRASLVERGTLWVRKHHRSFGLAGSSILGTAALLMLVFLSTAWYRQTQVVPVSLATNHPPLAAEIRSDDGRLVARQTVPTQEALDIPAGQYRLQVSGESRLSETYQVNLQRGQSPQFNLNLDESLLGAPLKIDRSYKIVSADGRALVVMLDDDGLRGWDMQRNTLRWTTSLRSAEHPLLKALAGWVWPWNRLITSSPYHGWGSFDLTPFVVSPATDLNGDGVDDVILAARHQACVLAVSGEDGNVLWVAAARGQDLEQTIVNESARYQQGVVSGVLSAPTPAGDIDDDGIVDYAVLMAQEQNANQRVIRWLEVISGKSGQTIWRNDLPDHLFMGHASLDVAEDFRWFSGSGAASSWIGWNEAGLYSSVLKRDLSRVERTGNFHHVPSRVMVASWNAGATQPPRLTVLAGSHILAFDTETGEPVGTPIDCGMQAGQEPVLVDVDGDGANELVLMQELTPKVGIGGVGQASMVRMGVMSLAERRFLWTADLRADWPRPDWPRMPVADQQWPVVEDLDNDGKEELIVPSGTSKSTGKVDEAWGELQVLDGTTGKLRWKHRLKTMDQQVDHFLVGPDIDGDGVAEVFAATLWSRDFDLYVDALSGRDGKSLWVGRHPLRKNNESVRYRLAPPKWWKAGTDGWPQLIVPVSPMLESQQDSLVCAFSAGTGELTRFGSKMIELETRDAEGDGIEDLFAFQNSSPTAIDAGGTLLCFRGQPRQWWKSIGDGWSATVDLNGDGTRDLTRTLPDGSVFAASGKDGQLLWKTTFPEPDLHQLRVQAAVPRQDGLAGPSRVTDELLPLDDVNDADPFKLAPGDFDRDGTIDLLVYVGHLGKEQPSPPLFCLSGRTGRRIWAAELQARYVAGVHALDARDLDGDGIAELIWIGASDWGFPDDRLFNIHQKQLSLHVLSGRNGRMLWHEPLTRPYGLTPQNNVAPSEFDQGTVAVCYGDLNADGVLDLLVPGDVDSTLVLNSGVPNKELRVLDGRSGDRLWQVALPAVRNTQRAFNDLPPPAIADLDGDGRPEVVVLSFQTLPGADRSLAILRALESTDGQERWSRQFDVSHDCGQLPFGDQGSRDRPRPMPLRTASGASLICLNLGDGPERVVVVDGNGEAISDFRLETKRGYHRGSFRVWACDTQGDRNDEIVFANRDYLMAIRPQDPDVPLWQHEVPHLWTDEIEGILPTTDSHGHQIVVRHLDSPGMMYALDAETGERAWTVPTPTSQPGTLPFGNKPGQIAMIGDSSASLPPRLFFQNQFVSIVCEASMMSQTPNASGKRESINVASLGTRVSARLSSANEDSRHGKSLPWNPPERTITALPAIFAWSVFYCVMLLYLPGAYAVRSIKRQWSLRWMLLLPLVVAAPLIALMTDSPAMSTNELTAKVLVAVVTLPAVHAVVQLVGWSIKRSWRPVVIWLAVSLVASVLLAVVSLLATEASSSMAMEDEHYTWNGWWFIWLYGAYVTGLLLTISVLIKTFVNQVIQWVRRSNSMPGAV